MSLFDAGTPLTLEDALGHKADTQSAGITDSYNQQRRKLVGQQAHSGRLGSGVSNYNFGDLNAAEVGDLGNVQSNLAESLGQIPGADFSSTQDYQRQLQLAKLIGELNKPSDAELIMQGAFGGAGAGSAAGPWGALFGGLGGAALGGAAANK